MRFPMLLRLERTLRMAAAILLLSLSVPSFAQEDGSGFAYPSSVCFSEGYLTPRLAGGMLARLTPGEPNNVRAEPPNDMSLVGTINPGQTVYVTSAPRCLDGLVWWQVMYRPVAGPNDFPFGWTAEGDDGEYWLEPVLQTMTIPSQRQPITPENASALVETARSGYGLVSDVVWSDDGRYLAVNAVGSVWIYDMSAGGSEPLWLYPNPADTNLTNSIVFATDQNVVATAGGPDGRFNLWSLTDGSLVNSFNPETGVYGATTAISPDLSTLATADTEGSVTLWDITDKTPTVTFDGHTLLGGMQFDADSTTLITIGGSGMMDADMTARFWDVETGIQTHLFEGSALPTFVDHNRILLAPASDNGLQVIDTTTLETLTTLPGAVDPQTMTYPVLGYLPSPDNTVIASIRTTYDPMTNISKSTVQLIDQASGEYISSYDYGGVTNPKFSADGRIFAFIHNHQTSGTTGYTLVMMDTGSGQIVSEHHIPARVSYLNFSPDGTLLALVYEDPQFWGPNNVTLWTVQ